MFLTYALFLNTRGQVSLNLRKHITVIGLGFVQGHID